MKNLHTITKFLCFTALLLIAGCDEALDLKPVGDLPISDSYANPTLVEAQVNGMYNSMYNAGSVGSYATIASDLLAADSLVTFDGTFTGLQELAASNVSVDNPNVLQIWRDLYITISRANLLLEYYPNAGAASDQNRVRGEALVLRANSYFHLVKYWGKQFSASANSDLAVPLYTAPIPVDDPLQIPEQYLQSRATVAAVYNQIIADLRSAVNLLPDTNKGYLSSQSVVNARVNKDIARALLARVYLQRGDYANAGAYADSVISSARDYTVNTDFLSPYRNSGLSSESSVIWALQQNATNNSGGGNQGMPAHWGGGSTFRGDIFFRNSEDDGQSYFGGNNIGLYDDTRWWDSSTDVRRPSDANNNAQYRDGSASSFDDAAWTTKWSGPPSEDWTVPRNLPLIRIPEMYLIRAEASLRGAFAGNALNDVNAVRTPRNAPALTNVTLETIFLERTRELYAEGHYLWDKKRLGRFIEIPQDPDPAIRVSSLDQRFILPIPQRACQTNPRLCQ